AGYDRALKLAKPKRRGFAADRPVELEIAAAHPRRLDFDDNVMRTGCRVGKFSDLQFTSAQETHPAHRALPKLPAESRMRARLRATGAGRGCNSICASSPHNAQPRTYPQAVLTRHRSAEQARASSNSADERWLIT